MRNPKILVIDSGIGGLSVTQHVLKLCPGIDLTYVADLAHFPYGDKTERQVIRRMIELVEASFNSLRPDLIIIACNTASTIALEALRARFNIPFIGVVPAIKPAASITSSGVIGVLATTGTISRLYTQNLIKEFAQDAQVHLHGSSELVCLAEQKLRGHPSDARRLAEDLRPFLVHSTMDTVVLACTHFPLMKQELAALLPSVKHWIDSGEAIARRTASLLKQMNLPFAQAPTARRLVLTRDPATAYRQDLLTDLLGDFCQTTLEERVSLLGLGEGPI